MSEPMKSHEILPSENPDDNGEHTNTLAASSMDESSSESNSESDDEVQEALELKTLESELSRSPSNYDLHVKYIKLLRKLGEIDKLRQARESMSEIFPLTPTMWQEWAKDETTLSSRPEAIAAIEKIYERGASDYMSVPLWCDYLNFMQEHEPSIRECSAAGVSKARNLFERALTAAGLHFSEGIKIWENYREFEQAICLTIEDSDTEGKEKQIQRIRNIFHRQLSVPLADMNSSLHAYKVWEVELGSNLDVNSGDLEGISTHVASAYKKALEMYNARVDLEEQISKSGVPDRERLPLFKRYLKFEESTGDPARVQILYERAITEFPISSDLWIDYTHYLEKMLKVGNVLKEAISRATRNCPWVGELWVRRLLCLERVHASEDEISLVFEKALQCSFSSYEEYLDLFLTRLDGLRRRISMAGEMQVFDYAVVRDTFQEICKSWLRFEREFGTLEDYDYAVQKVSPRLEELRMFNLQQECKTVATIGDSEHSSKKKAREKRKPISNLLDDQSPLKRLKDIKDSSQKGAKKDDDKGQDVSTTTCVEETVANAEMMDSRNEQPKEQNMHGKAKEQNMHEMPKYTDQCTAFMSNLDLKVNYEDIRKFFSDVGGVQSIRILKDRETGKSRGLAYVDFCDDAHLEAAVAKNRQWLLKKKISIARSDPSRSKKQSGTRHRADRDGPQIPTGENASIKGRDNDGIQLKGKNTFAVPRNVRPLGFTANKPKADEEDEKPKSNDEFRNMLLKK
ncbi:uncharacterized protein LOC104897005 isoform X2 [Beta vulgaris subsp. vulgaris]|uniref:uncharacterized protein LOC104897005 isoform X2 n=1 Tax=Beta vulgaris subsp. vulgaris TaxID=3555 RepID=UPI00254890E5|nr:uncharacterized protein LOC104897005 isoform X2 [Beta vulgaris subsp. vulgaris]